MKQYNIVVKGESPLIMHSDNIAWNEKVKAWSKDPANRDKSVAGDDRTPVWTWIGYTYHDGKEIGVPSDNLMTMFREGGAKVIKTGKSTFKKETQAGILIDQQQWPLYIDGKTIPVTEIDRILKLEEFADHIKAAEDLGFELLVKRAKIGASKHVRVRPMFRYWELRGSLTVLDPERTGLTRDILQTILDQSGALCGLGDWRPSSPKSPGVFGRFSATIE
jgi:hypothetical protein